MPISGPFARTVKEGKMHLVFLILLGVTQAEPPKELIEVANGTFVLVESKSNINRALEMAVQRTVDSLSWAFRPLAKTKLKSAVSACPSYTMALSQNLFSVQCEGQSAFVRNLVGPNEEYRDEDGNLYNIDLKLGEQKIELKFSGKLGGQSSKYLFDEKGILVVTNTIFSEHLPEPLVWTLHYQ